METIILSSKPSNSPALATSAALPVASAIVTMARARTASRSRPNPVTTTQIFTCAFSIPMAAKPACQETGRAAPRRISSITIFGRTSCCDCKRATGSSDITCSNDLATDHFCFDLSWVNQDLIPYRFHSERISLSNA